MTEAGAEPDLRRRILLIVEEYPGLHLREIQRRAGTSAMLAEYHLNIMEKLGLITSATRGRYRDFFPVRSVAMQLDETDRRWLGLLRRPAILRIALLLLEGGALRPIQLARTLQLVPSTAAYQFKLMESAGLALVERRGNRSILRLGDPARVLEILRTYHPSPDAISSYAETWANVFERPGPASTAEPVVLPQAPTPVADLEEVSLPATVANLSSSVQTVYAALVDEVLTSKELTLETGLGRRTVYTALKQLRDLGLVGQQGNLRDMRQTKFWVKKDGEAATQP
ncbi:MAG: winged helix-turn-helix transcriptional regulator [Candidatus Thermoplasmatota archaeon]|jgi:predicted transcriptional regulator